MTEAPERTGMNGSRFVVAAALLASTVFFVMGTVTEHKRAETVTMELSDAARARSGVRSEERTEVKPYLDETESVFGLEVEAASLIAVAAGLSALLALFVLATRWRLPLLAVALLCIAFVVLDVGEVAYQVDESNTGLAVIALVTTLGHLASGGLAARLLLRPVTG